jgi:ubiquinone biosynthesis protein UbiJ
MWDWAVWSALIVGGIAGFAAIGLLRKRVLEAWRTLKEVRRHAAESLGELAAKAEQTAAKVEAAADTEELQESVARLRVSLAQLNVLQAALDEARA